MKYEIERNIEVPEKSGKSKYPFADMGVGDSFEAGKFSKKSQLRLSSAWRSWTIRCKKEDWMFSVRKMDDKVRVWRTQ